MNRNKICATLHCSTRRVYMSKNKRAQEGGGGNQPATRKRHELSQMLGPSKKRAADASSARGRYQHGKHHQRKEPNATKGMLEIHEVHRNALLYTSIVGYGH